MGFSLNHPAMGGTPPAIWKPPEWATDLVCSPHASSFPAPNAAASFRWSLIWKSSRKTRVFKPGAATARYRAYLDSRPWWYPHTSYCACVCNYVYTVCRHIYLYNCSIYLKCCIFIGTRMIKHGILEVPDLQTNQYKPAQTIFSHTQCIQYIQSTDERTYIYIYMCV